MITYIFGVIIGSYCAKCWKKRLYSEWFIIHIFGLFILLAILIHI